MTHKSDFKALVRARQQITGEKYTSARLKILESKVVLPSTPDVIPTISEITAVVISCKNLSLRLRTLDTKEILTFRAPQGAIWKVIPGQLIKINLLKRWIFQGHPYATGTVVSTWTDTAAMGISPLPLTFHGICDLKKVYEPFTRSDPNYKLWKKAVSAPRNKYEFDAVAWGIVCPEEPDAPENEFTCDAADMADPADAKDLLMKVLALDIRCIDAHAHLGNLIFKLSPERAIGHYKMGVAIGDLTLGANFEGVLPWGHLYNRPYLRAAHGLGLCLWRMGRQSEAQAVFERILALNPADNQGVRYCWDAIRQEKAWESLE